MVAGMKCSVVKKVSMFLKAISSGQNMKAAGCFKILVPITSLQCPSHLNILWLITHKATFFIAAHLEKQTLAANTA